MDSEILDLVKKLAPEGITVHRVVSTVLAKVSSCSHDVPRDTLLWMDFWICARCTQPLTTYQDTINRQNPVLGKYVQCKLLDGHTTPRFARGHAAIITKLLRARITHFEQYMENMGRKMDTTCIDYWNNYGMVRTLGGDTARTVGGTYESSSLYVFPGRTHCRSGIVFELSK